MLEKDINFELRKLVALNFPAIFFTLLGHDDKLDESQHSSKDSDYDPMFEEESSSSESEEEHKTTGKKVLYKARTMALP